MKYRITFLMKFFVDMLSNYANYGKKLEREQFFNIPTNLFSVCGILSNILFSFSYKTFLDWKERNYAFFNDCGVS